jgi:hypothetical protein
MQQTIKELTPILNEAITSILGSKRVIAHHDIELNKFTMTENSFLFPSSFNRIENCIHFTPEFIDHEDDFSFFDREVENYLKNIIRLIRQSSSQLIFSFKLNITFNHFEEIVSETTALPNSTLKSFRLIIKIYELDDYNKNSTISFSQFNKIYDKDSHFNRFVIFGKTVNDDMVIINRLKLFENLNTLKQDILLKYPDFLLHDLDFDLSKPPEEFEKELLVLEMSRI